MVGVAARGIAPPATGRERRGQESKARDRAGDMGPHRESQTKSVRKPMAYSIAHCNARPSSAA
eukprot:11165016-Lingulodinium_polyedra.AAC.1